MRYLLFFLFLFRFLPAEPPQVVVFDYGGVIAKVDRKPVIDFLSKSLGVSYKKVKHDFANEKIYRAFNFPHSYWEGYSKQTLSRKWIEELEAHKRMMVREIDGMRDVIQKIKEQGIQVALLSNTNPHRARFIEKMGGYDAFDPILLSCHLGLRKPDPEIFKLLLKYLGKPADKCVFIDNKKSNIRAAIDLGIDGVQFTTTEELKRELIRREIAF